MALSGSQITRIGVGGGGRAYGTITAKSETAGDPALPLPNYKYSFNAITSELDKVVNNMSVLKAIVDTTDPTTEAVSGRIAITLQGGTTVYIAVYTAP